MRVAGLSVASIAVTAAALIMMSVGGALLTDVGPWYRDLRKPPWNPPNWLFGPAWTLIYALVGSAIVIAWNAPDGRPAQRAVLVGAVAINFALNLLWSALFFAKQRPDWAFAEVIALWLSILALVLALRPLSRTAALLVLPYLAWVTFAAVLNWRIVTLNRPFSPV
jgi:tryptophan-rich sensory protein